MSDNPGVSSPHSMVIGSKCGPLRSRAWIKKHQPMCGCCGRGLFGRAAVWVPGCAHHEYPEGCGFWACSDGCGEAIEAYTRFRSPVPNDYEINARARLRDAIKRNERKR